MQLTIVPSVSYNGKWLNGYVIYTGNGSNIIYLVLHFMTRYNLLNVTLFSLQPLRGTCNIKQAIYVIRWPICYLCWKCRDVTVYTNLFITDARVYFHMIFWVSLHSTFPAYSFFIPHPTPPPRANPVFVSALFSLSLKVQWCIFILITFLQIYISLMHSFFSELLNMLGFFTVFCRYPPPLSSPPHPAPRPHLVLSPPFYPFTFNVAFSYCFSITLSHVAETSDDGTEGVDLISQQKTSPLKSRSLPIF